MKILLQNPISKNVEYLGCEITIPFWTKYLAFDKDGILYAYECKPYIKCRPGAGVGSWWNSDYDLRSQSIGNVSESEVNWGESLREVE